MSWNYCNSHYCEPSEEHATSYPHRGIRGGVFGGEGVDRKSPWVFVVFFARDLTYVRKPVMMRG